jgi:release factor glutamine methyltransferase
MKINSAIKEATTTLKDVAERPKLEAEILMCHYLSKDRVYLHINGNKDVDSGYFELIQRRANSEPIEYITKSASFYSEEFFVDYGALIPRPETELLIDTLLPHLKSSDRVVEIGVGSGIISIMLAKLYPEATYYGGDISSDALKIAKTNRTKFGLDEKIEFFLSNLLDEFDKEIDVIVSNPPYIEDGIKLEKPLDYEPQNALFGGKIGDEILKDIIDLAYSRNARVLACEMGYDQKDKIINYIKNKGYEYKSLEFYKDYASLDRGFLLEVR